MLFRAVFWIGLVSVLMPREPDLGFGDPSPTRAVTSAVSGWVQDKAGVADTDVPALKGTARSLADVKAEIMAARYPS